MSQSKFKRLDPISEELKGKIYSTDDYAIEIKTMTLEEIKSKYPNYIKDADIVKPAKGF